MNRPKDNLDLILENAEQITKNLEIDLAKADLSTIEKLQAENRELREVLRVSKELREAQKNYMANRGDNELGKIVAIKASKFDVFIEAFETSEG